MQGFGGGAFEELGMYQRARELTNTLYAFTRNGAFEQDPILSARLRCAALSIMSHIAEGFEHGTTTALVHGLCMAKTACGDVRAHLQIACDQRYITQAAHMQLHTQAQLVSKMIADFMSRIPGSADLLRKSWPWLRQVATDAAPACAPACPASCSSTVTAPVMAASMQT